MSAAETFLSKLSKVRERTPNEWTACCPAHEDKHPSLGVRVEREPEGEKILVNCLAGCSFFDIVESVGMTVSEFFPERRKPDTLHKRMQPKFSAQTLLGLLNRDLIRVGLLAAQKTRTGTLTADELQALSDAEQRLAHLMELLP